MDDLNLNHAVRDVSYIKTKTRFQDRSQVKDAKEQQEDQSTKEKISNFDNNLEVKLGGGKIYYADYGFI